MFARIPNPRTGVGTWQGPQIPVIATRFSGGVQGTPMEVEVASALNLAAMALQEKAPAVHQAVIAPTQTAYFLDVADKVAALKASQAQLQGARELPVLRPEQISIILGAENYLLDHYEEFRIALRFAGERFAETHTWDVDVRSVDPFGDPLDPVLDPIMALFFNYRTDPECFFKMARNDQTRLQLIGMIEEAQRIAARASAQAVESWD